MVLYFTKYLLDQKHQLSKIWIAAHWEKKIKRAQICEVDIVRSVEDILSAEIFLDLRISGHLLIGIVKIHSRKVKYLLTECNEIFYQVKSFRTGVIDLPDSQKTAVVNKITLTEFFDNFETVENNIVDTISTSNQSRIEDITLKETTEKLTILNEDDMMDFAFNEDDGPIAFDEDFIKNYEVEMSLFGNDKDIISAVEKELDDVPRDQEEINMEVPELYDNQVNEILETVEIANVDGQIVPDQSNLCLQNGQLVQDSGDNSDISAIQPNESTSELYLEPMKIYCLKNKKSRKRKLCVDFIKSIPHEVIKKQVLDTSDITSVTDLAPASKRLMTLKEIGSAEQLLCLPTLKILNSDLLHLYKRNLKSCEDDRFDLSSEEEERPESSHKMLTRAKKSSTQENALNVSTSLQNSVTKPISNVNANSLNVQSDIPALDKEFMDDLGHKSMEIDECLEREYMEETLQHQETVEPQETIPEIQSTNTDEMLDSQMSKTSEEKWEFAFQRKIFQMLHCLKILFEKNSSIGFSAIVKNNKKSLVAQRFVCLLMLKKFQVISLKQSEAYGEIIISPEANFDSACLKFCEV